MTAPPGVDQSTFLPAGAVAPGFAWNTDVSDEPERQDGRERYTAVIDVGSGSARAVVMQVNPGGGIEIVAQQRVNLNLMSHVDEDGSLDEIGVANTVDALEDFAMVARGFGVQNILAVGTAALRESRNALAIIDTADERFGVPLRIIPGDDEAAYCFLGAIHGLPVADGLLADIGGGSTELVEFQRPHHACERFLAPGKPTNREPVQSHRPARAGGCPRRLRIRAQDAPGSRHSTIGRQ